MAISATLSELSMMTVVTSLGVLLLSYALSIIVYRIRFHPLANYPGPFLGKFTDIYPMKAMFTMKRLYWQYDMLTAYGSPVRVSTNQLFFSDSKSWQDIYGQSSNPCLKEPAFYKGLSATGATSVLNETGKA